VALRAGLASAPSPGVLFAASYAAAFQAVRPEVYALAAWLSLAALERALAFDVTGDRRALFAAALYAGLALCNHHLLALMALTPAALALVGLARAPGRGRLLARLWAAGALFAPLYLYLPLRAAHHPLVDWGAPTTPARFFWTVSARAFQKAAARGGAGDLVAALAAFADQLHPLAALSALGGLYLVLRVAPLRRAGLLLFLPLVGVVGAPALVGFDVANPDAYGYLEAAVALGAVLAVLLPAALLCRAPRRLTVPLALAVVLVCQLGGRRPDPRGRLARLDDAAATFGAFLGRAPPRANVVTSYFQTVFGLYYATGVEGQRPDVELVHRHFLAYPGYREDLVARAPQLAPLLGERDVRVAGLADAPALIEYDLDLPAPLIARSVVVTRPPSVSLDEPQARRYFAWQAFLAAHRACRVGAPGELAEALRHARTVLPESRELKALERGECAAKLRSP
jgi:hypothetical protein